MQWLILAAPVWGSSCCWHVDDGLMMTTEHLLRQLLIGVEMIRLVVELKVVVLSSCSSDPTSLILAWLVSLVIFLISQKRFDLLVFQSKYKFQVAVEKSSWRRKQEVSQIDTDLFWFKQWKINDLQYYIQYLKWIKINIKCIVTMAQRCIWRSIKLR